jgi:hypothetical protein
MWRGQGRGSRESLATPDPERAKAVLTWALEGNMRPYPIHNC